MPDCTRKPLFLGHPIYRGSSYGGWHPLRVPRVSTVTDLSRAMGWLPPDQYRTSPRAKVAALEIFHDPEYLKALVHAEHEGRVTPEISRQFGLGTPSNPVFPEMFRRPATSAGGSMLAAHLLLAGATRIVFHPAGGTHHGMRDRANGFCFLNDPVLAMLSLQQGGLRRIAYVDIDAHHPDGVEAAFVGAPDVLMLSVHEENRWPRTGALTDRAQGAARNLPVPQRLNDSEMAVIRDRFLVPMVADFAPDVLVIQCGADAVTEDPMSRLCLSNNAHWQIALALMPLAPRLLVLGGGGYNPWSVGRLWTGLWAVLNGIAVPEILPEQAENVLRALDWEGPNTNRFRPFPEHWFTSLRDLPREGPVRAEITERIAALLQ